jgi:succinate-acetate transporter protein
MKEDIENEKENNIKEEKKERIGETDDTFIKNYSYKIMYKVPQEKNIQNFNSNLDLFLYNIKYYSLLVNKLDTYGNSIPLGSFCFAISFILIGFKESKVNDEDDDFFYLIILIFGCIGQLIAGLLEYIKGRTFVSNLYLLYGLYFLSYYYFYHCSEGIDSFVEEIKPFYYGSWAVLSFPIFVGSVRSNVFYLVQNAVACTFFVVRCIGEYKEKPKMNEIVSGVLELVTGFVSLYICVNQIINESFRFKAIPSLPLSPDNEIDINFDN